jgi:hypothetical protein
MSKLILNKEEFELIKRQVTRMYEHKSRGVAREVRRRDNEYKLLKGVDSRLIQAGEQTLNRNDLRAVEGICNLGLKALTELIIPGYTERKSKESDLSAQIRYQEYIDKALLTKAKYEGILIKLEVLL